MPQYNIPLLGRFMGKLRRRRRRRHDDLENAQSIEDSESSLPTQTISSSLPSTLETLSSHSPAVASSAIPVLYTTVFGHRYYKYCGLCVHTQENSFDDILEKRWSTSILDRLATNVNSVMFNASLQMTSQTPEESPVRTILIVCEDQATLKQAEEHCSHLDWFQTFVSDYGFRVTFAVAPNAVLCASHANVIDLQAEEAGSYAVLSLPYRSETLCGMQLESFSSGSHHNTRSTVGGIVVYENELYLWVARHAFSFDDVQQQSSSVGVQDRSYDTVSDTQQPTKISRLSRWRRDTTPKVRETESPTRQIRLDVLDAKHAAFERTSGPSHDWCLLKLSRKDPELMEHVLKPNKSGQRPIQGHIPLDRCFRGDVTMTIANLGTVFGKLSTTSEAIVMENSTYHVRRIVLDQVLERGSSGAWVVQDGHVIGYLIGASETWPWAYMLPMEQSLRDAGQQLGSEVRIATSEDILRFRKDAVTCKIRSEISNTIIQSPGTFYSPNLCEGTQLHSPRTLSRETIFNVKSSVTSSYETLNNQILASTIPDITGPLPEGSPITPRFTGQTPSARDPKMSGFIFPAADTFVEEATFFSQFYVPHDDLKKYSGHVQMEKYRLVEGADCPIIETVPRDANSTDLTRWLKPLSSIAEDREISAKPSEVRILMIETKNEFTANPSKFSPSHRTIPSSSEIVPTPDAEQQVYMVQDIFRHVRLPLEGLAAYLKAHITFSNNDQTEYDECGRPHEVSRFFCSSPSSAVCWTYSHKTRLTSAVMFYRQGDGTSRRSVYEMEMLKLRCHLSHPLLLAYIYTEKSMMATFQMLETMNGETFEIESSVGLASWDWVLDREIPPSQNQFQDESEYQKSQLRAAERYNVLCGKLINVRFRLRSFGVMLSWMRRMNTTYANRVRIDADREECAELDDQLDRMEDFNKVYSHDADTLMDRLNQQMSSIARLSSHRDQRISLAVADINGELAWQGKETNTSMRGIAFMTFLFLPGIFIASVFSTDFFDFRSTDQKTVVGKAFWIFLISYTFTTTLFILCWIMYNRVKTKFEHEQQRKRRQMLRNGITKQPMRVKRVDNTRDIARQEAGGEDWSFWSRSRVASDVEMRIGLSSPGSLSGGLFVRSLSEQHRKRDIGLFT